MTNEQVGQLSNLRILIVHHINKACFNGKLKVDNIRIMDYDLLEVLMLELRIKGFDVSYHSQCDNMSVKDKPYFILEISW
nr:MAG TPA: hypothetical protein [Caudoviricetes sp.]